LYIVRIIIAELPLKFSKKSKPLEGRLDNYRRIASSSPTRVSYKQIV